MKTGPLDVLLYAMKEKALKNIEAAKLLFKNSLYDSTASRAYYSAYLMAWHYMKIIGKDPTKPAPDGTLYWPHHYFHEILCENGAIGPLQMEEWEIMMFSRIKADYYPDEIEETEARKSVLIASEFIEHFEREEGALE